MTIFKTLSAVTLMGTLLATTSGCVIHEHDHGYDHGRYCATPPPPPPPREVTVYRPVPVYRPAPAPVVVDRGYYSHGYYGRSDCN